MKSVTNKADQQEIRNRLNSLTPDAPRQWGTMSAHQMMCHLTDSFRLTTGEKAACVTGGWFERNIIKLLALYVPMQWPKDVPTRPEMDQVKGSGTRPQDFEKDKQMLLFYLDQFCRQPRVFTPGAHPIFGEMTAAQWHRWAYLHIDHHLRQFDR